MQRKAKHYRTKTGYVRKSAVYHVVGFFAFLGATVLVIAFGV